MAYLSAASYYDRSTGKVVVRDDVVRNHLVGCPDQLLFIAITGPYQNGKSSFISYFTGDTAVTIGNGVESETKGVWLYGPYSLNSLKSRWQIPEVPGDETKVILIDTEGFQSSDVGVTFEENKLLMCQMIAPYLAISQVSILMHPTNIERGSLETLKYFLEVTQRISAGANSSCYGGNHMSVIDIINGVVKFPISEVDEIGRRVELTYVGTPESFEKASEYVKGVQIQRFTGDNASFHVQIDHFWPLPTFHKDKDVFHQEENFKRGFALIAQKLLSILDRAKCSHKVNGEGALAAFEQYVKEGIRNENIEELAKTARELAEYTTAERIVAPIIDGYVSGAKAEIREEYMGLVRDFARNPRRSTPERSATEIIDACLRKMDQCPGINSIVLRSERWENRKQEVRTSLLDSERACLAEYEGHLDELHKGILIASLAAFLTRKAARCRSLLQEEVGDQRDTKGVNVSNMVDTEVEKAWAAFEKTKEEELGVSRTLSEEIGAAASAAFSRFQDILNSHASALAAANKKERNDMIVKIVGGCIQAAGEVALQAMGVPGGGALIRSGVDAIMQQFIKDGKVPQVAEAPDWDQFLKEQIPH